MALAKTTGLLQVRGDRLTLTTLGRVIFSIVERKFGRTYTDLMWGTLTRTAWPQDMALQSGGKYQRQPEVSLHDKPETLLKTSNFHNNTLGREDWGN